MYFILFFSPSLPLWLSSFPDLHHRVWHRMLSPHPQHPGRWHPRKEGGVGSRQRKATIKAESGDERPSPPFCALRQRELCLQPRFPRCCGTRGGWGGGCVVPGWAWREVGGPAAAGWVWGAGGAHIPALCPGGGTGVSVWVEKRSPLQLRGPSCILSGSGTLYPIWAWG